MKLGRTTLLLWALGLVVGQAGLASAKNLCLVDDQLFPSGYVLTKVKLPKKVGTSTLLSGYVVGSLGTRSTLTGVAIMRSGGVVAVTIRATPIDMSNTAVTATWQTTDPLLQSDAVRFDTDNDGVQDDLTATFVTLDCATAPLP